ncbi:DUF1275 domain-containing protein [Lactococcus taiwanensis]|jgi:uncharacterized membrane protein YoaK (UPF0700 family)|uniref:DUF1275 domain-containing protein n=1 Tax=Lactococcus taiwanensis TaxID=1151742 RepID=A0AA45KHG7_9LACT|nr:YoaK family protein [Lactococcus taiwanensis]KZK38364.1 putative Membrane protein [Lactococcus cremoris]QRZ10216.1 DUF1275 domain-containing protein [Lactococcus taiwanensis]QSE77420.1 DUF1275 domain-containing protein [Lactococcus taiwanensis]
MDKQVKEKMRIALLFALNAGFMDGFSFFHFDDRFIGAQSGNLIQAGINIAQGNFPRFWNFVIPMIFFVLGVMTRGFYSHYLMKRHRFDATYLLLIQWLGVTTFAIAYGLGLQLPVSVYVGLFSFFMAIQYDAFTKVHGRAYGSIFMTGNMKSMSANLAQYFLTKDQEKLRSAGIYVLLIGIFFLGAIIATLAGNWFGSWTMLGSTILIGAAYLIMRFEV